MELRDKARDILDCFLFEDIINNRVPDEDNWAITYSGDEFVVLDYKTMQTFNFKVTIEPGSLSAEEIRQLGEDQEWWEDDE